MRQTCDHILAHKPDVVITEKGLSDLAAHFLSKAGVSAIRRLRKTDANRVARACGATIVHRPDEIRDSDIGTVRSLYSSLSFPPRNKAPRKGKKKERRRAGRSRPHKKTNLQKNQKPNQTP